MQITQGDDASGIGIDDESDMDKPFPCGDASEIADPKQVGCGTRNGRFPLGQTLRMGVPFAFSMHAELLQYWLSASGANQTRLDIRTVPPSLMADALAAGEIDLFCVGEPWGSVAVDAGVGNLLLPTKAIWANAPEKLLATRVSWAEREPKVAGALLRAIWRSGRWLSDIKNRTIASEVLTGPSRLAVTPEVAERALSGRIVISPDGQERQMAGFIEFHTGAAGFPWRSQAAWIGAALARRHGLDVTTSCELAATTFRSDLYRLHLRSTGAELPSASSKLEGALSVPTPVPSERGQLILPKDQFFDARIFDPSHPLR